MADPLITVAQLEARIGRSLDTTQAEAYIADASALVREIAETDFLDEFGQVDLPAALVPVVVQMTLRGIKNPLGRSSEDIGDASWQGMGTVYATRREKAIIRRVRDTVVLGVGEVPLGSYSILPPVGVTDDLTGSL